MDGDTMNEKQCVLYKLAACIAENNRREAEAVQGYTEQLALIQQTKEAYADDGGALAFLTSLEAETQEKIADELSHSDSLNAEYVQMTGIAPKED